MKILSVYRFIVTLVLCSLIISGCGSTQPTQVDEPTSPPQIPPVQNTPADVPIDLAGPELGSSMVWVDNSILLYNPGGGFKMGGGGQDNPEHDVSISPFWIYRTEVTNRMYALCVAVGKCTPPLDKFAAIDLGTLSLRENPVVGVDWQQASDYCSWVEGRLPTEAEWELTARGPENGIFPWGDTAPLCDQANFKDCIGNSSRVYDYPTGKSYYDALDLAGNVFEWVGDYYRTKYYLESPTQDPPGPDSGTNRVVRGGSYETDIVELASAKRSNYDPTQTRRDLGFRCVVLDPVLHPSFCQASAFAADIDPKDVTPSGGACEILAQPKGHDCGIVTADIKGGTITDVSASTFDCSQVSDTRVYCTGSPGTSDLVTICGECGPSNGEPPIITDAISTCGGAFAALANAAGDSGQCTYQDGPAGNGCPSGMNENSDGTCSEPVGGPSRCPVGMYLSRNQVCTSVTPPKQTCTGGFTYDEQAGCCSGVSYPGCGPNEFDTPYGCVQLHRSTESSSTSCVTLSLETGACSNGGGPDGPVLCQPQGSGKYTCSTWDYGKCQWDDSCG